MESVVEPGKKYPSYLQESEPEKRLEKVYKQF